MPPTMPAIATGAAGIDFSSDGLRRYRVRLSDGGASPIELPLAVIRNGSGPSVLVAGGRGHEFAPSGNLQATPGSPEYAAMLPALLAFDAPYAIVFDEVGGPGMPHTGTLEGLARTLGKRAISSELGGGGRATPDTLA